MKLTVGHGSLCQFVQLDVSGCEKFDRLHTSGQKNLELEWQNADIHLMALINEGRNRCEQLNWRGYGVFPLRLTHQCLP